MSREVIDKVFQSVEYVSTITFTGGEPTLAVSVIEQVTESARGHRVDIGNFWVATNGKTKPAAARRFALALLDLYSSITEPQEGITALAVSGDAWHELTEVPDVYKGLSFFQAKRHGPEDVDQVINTGRALQNGIGSREPKPLGPFEIDYHDDPDHLQVDTIYVAANGNVVSDCDRSFKDIDAATRGNVLRETLQEIVARDVKVTSEA